MTASFLLGGRGQGAKESRLLPTSGFALVATLLMISVITGAAVAFFQSTRIERFVSRNYADMARAQLAAEGGIAAGQGLITALFTNYPDSAVGWARLADTELATFYFRTTDASGFATNGSNAANPASQTVFLFAHPLASGANAAALNSFTASSVVFTNTNTPGGGTGLTTNNRVDLNADNWIGTPPGGNRPALRAKWVEILRDPSRPKDTSLDASGFPVNPAVARYAFWAEDESFRINLNRCGANPRGNNTAGTNTAEIALQGALFGTNTALAQGLTNLQGSLRTNLPTPGILGLANPTNNNNYDTNRFVVSVYSSALNLSRGGTLRLNLNQVVANVSPTATNYSPLVRTQLNRMLSAITNSNTLTGSSNTAAMPNFGQRFYRSAETPVALNASQVVGQSAGNNLPDIYLQKIVANLRDYIDADSIPTAILNQGSFPVDSQIINPRPWNGQTGNGPFENELAAVGKEPVPMLTEFAVILRHTAVPPGTSFNFDLSFYFEFWNPTTRTISMGELGNPTLTLLNLYRFNVRNGNGSITNITIDGRTTNRLSRIDLPLAALSPPPVFLPNSFTVFSTDPMPWPAEFGYARPTNFYNIPTLIRYQGVRTSANDPVQAALGPSDGRAGTTSSNNDYDLWVMLAGNQGILESFTALPTGHSSTTHAMEFTNTTITLIRASSLPGNNPSSISSRSGDPRSLNEPIRIYKYLSSANDISPTLSQYRFANSTTPQTSFGFFNPSSINYFSPANWADFSTNITAGSADQAPYRHRNGSLDTIGRLGDLFDPARRAVDSAAPLLPVMARGGGRTLKIGQAERRDNSLNPSGLWDGSETSASRNWTAWRLADVFTTENPSPPWPLADRPPNPLDWNNNGILDANVVSQIPNGTNSPIRLAFPSSELDAATRFDGLVNVNGALRDNGAALRALVFGLVYESSPEGALATGGRSLNVDNLVTAFRNHLAGGTVDTNPSNDRLFWERGQISELADAGNSPIFSSPLNTLGVALSGTQDRGREEVVRRMMDLVTTKGNTYTVYAIGQSLNPRTGQPVATQRVKRTFRLNPSFLAERSTDRQLVSLPADAGFDPSFTGRGSGEDRFRRPTGFTATVLQHSIE